MREITEIDSEDLSAIKKELNLYRVLLLLVGIWIFLSITGQVG
jgi:hypothetical protein